MSGLPERALAGWLSREISGFTEIDSIEKFVGGQSNPTYKIATPSGPLVLRRKPFGTLLPSAHAIEREYRLMDALHPTGFPVPRPLAICHDAGIIGTPFYVMELVEGRNLLDATLPQVPMSERRAYYEAMVDTLAALHGIDPAATGLGDFGRPGNYIARQVERWTKQYRAAQTDDIPEVDRLIEWLPSTIPAQARSAITHGDYRLDNLILMPDQPQVRAVIDWELATIGDPLADFAYFAMHWSIPCDGRSGLGGVDLASQGIPQLDEMVQRYCLATGRMGFPDLHWYFAFNLFRLVGIVQGIKKRAAQGNAASASAEEMGQRVRPLAQAAWAEACQAGAR